MFVRQILHNCDLHLTWHFHPNVTIRYVWVLSILNPSVSVTFVHRSTLLMGLKLSAKFIRHFCTLPIFWVQILQKSSQGNSSVGGVKRKESDVTFGYLVFWRVSCHRITTKQGEVWYLGDEPGCLRRSKPLLMTSSNLYWQLVTCFYIERLHNYYCIYTVLMKLEFNRNLYILCFKKPDP